MPGSMPSGLWGLYRRARAKFDSFNRTIGTEPHACGSGARVFESTAVAMAGEAGAAGAGPAIDHGGLTCQKARNARRSIDD